MALLGFERGELTTFHARLALIWSKDIGLDDRHDKPVWGRRLVADRTDQVKDGMSRAFGARLRTGLATGTRSGLRSFVSGFVATIALQSSTATALMVDSFVERDLVKPRRAQIVLLGANVATAVTAGIGKRKN